MVIGANKHLKSILMVTDKTCTKMVKALGVGVDDLIKK